MKTKKSEDDLIEHWYSLVAGEQFSSKEFYGHIEREVAAQKVPGLEISHVDLSEGGVLSDKREYLRMQRERLIFDLCAAPIGVNYFFSYRFYLLPAVVKLWELVACFLVVGLIWWLIMRLLGSILGTITLVVSLVALVWLLKNAVGLGLRDLDAQLQKSPIISSIYLRWFHKDTYYRQDMRLAYCSIVSAIVKQEVARATAAKGVQLGKEYTRSPLLADLYHVKDASAASAPSPSSEPVGV